ncbi:MAG: DUF542 domain-containing protein [Deltaproteobacteria bacterium]|nr:DUF542 domain-containing protein [Deltaproteobacteria bacterium]
MTNPLRIVPETSVADVVAAHPELKAPLRKLGIDLCCGASLSLREAAEVRRINVDDIIKTLIDACASSPAAEQPRDESRAASDDARQIGGLVYRPFLLAALVVTVTMGAGMGAYNLLALHAGATSFHPALSQVHGAAQVWGFVFLFIMGVAYHALPRFLGTELRARRGARASLWLALAGIALTAAGRLVSAAWTASVIGALGALLTITAVAAFAYVLAATWRASPAPPDPIHRFLAAGTFWWLVAAALLLGQSVHTIQTASSPPHQANEAIYAAALFGGALMWIQGMFLRIGPVFLNLASTRTRLVHMTLFTANAGGFVAVAGLASPATATSRIAANVGLLLIAFSVLVYIAAVRPFSAARRLAEENRVIVRVIRAAFVASILFAVLAAIAAIADLIGAPSSRLLADGARHAFGLGFVTLMIFGVAARVVPVFGGVRLALPRALAIGATLIAVGVALRETQVLVALFGNPRFLTISALSGIPSAIGVFLASVSLVATLRSRAGRETDAAVRATPIAHDSNVAAPTLVSLNVKKETAQ